MDVSINMLTFIISIHYFHKSYGTEVISIPLKSLKLFFYKVHFILSSDQDVLSHPNEPDATPN